MISFSSRFSSRYLTAKIFEGYLKVFVQLPESFNSIPGYLHPLEGRFLYWLAGKVPPGGLALEVGSFKGKSSACIAAGLNHARLACVDTWHNDAMPYDDASDVMPEFVSNVEPYRDLIEAHRGTSTTVAATWTRPIDLLFIDGDHSYEGCRADLNAWIDFVKQGGWIAFHDSSEAGVASAINELFPEQMRSSNLNAWSVFAARKAASTE
jgi:predicted O-methyltransferase YrrM